MHKDFIDEYAAELTACLRDLDHTLMAKVVERIKQAHAQGRQIFIIGNGGSASTASHMACDLGKGTLGHKGDKAIPRFRIISLTDNVASLTAWANDTSYDEVFSQQLRNLMRPGDVLIAISASGNSANIVKAAETAKEGKVTVIGLAGFGGGKLKELADLCVVAKSHAYDVSEDLHLIIGHMLTRWFFRTLEEVAP